MAQKTIEDFKAVLDGGGIRPTMFEVLITPPKAMIDNSQSSQSDNSDVFSDVKSSELANLSLLIKSASIPASTTTTVNVGLPAGGILKLPGSRIFDSWQCTITHDKGMSLRSYFEKWSSLIIHHSDFIQEASLFDYTTLVDVIQLDRDASPIRKWTLHHAYPTNIDPEELSHESVDSLAQFSCTWNYQYFTCGPVDE